MGRTRFVLPVAFAAGTVVAAGAAVSAGWQGRRAAVAWSAPTALAASTEYASAPRLAVGAEGRAVAAWFGGPPPPVVFARSAGAAGSADVQTWTGSKVLVAQGTTTGGFGTPVILDTHGNDTALQVALSGSGVAYVAWGENKGPPMITSSIAGGPFAAPHRLLPPGGQLWGLVRSADGPVAAVWSVYPSSSPAGDLYYALLQPDGALGRPVKIGPWHGPVEGTPFALNDHGEFAAVDMRGENEQGPLTPTPRVHMCDSVKGCAPSHPLQFARLPTGAQGAEENSAIALSNNGTVTVLTGYSQLPKHPAANTPLGLWDAIRHTNGRWETHELALAGERPQVVSSGHASTTTLFDHFWTPRLRFLGDQVETAVLTPTRDRAAQPRIVRGLESPDLATITANASRECVVAGAQPESNTSARASIRAATGSCSHLGAAERVVSGEVGGGTPQAGIDDAGNAIILWIDFPHSGVFASLHRTR